MVEQKPLAFFNIHFLNFDRLDIHLLAVHIDLCLNRVGVFDGSSLVICNDKVQPPDTLVFGIDLRQVEADGYPSCPF